MSTKIARDAESGKSKNFGFVSFDNFDSSDSAIKAMDGQPFQNKIIRVSYAYKKDSKKEIHGTDAERFLAKKRPLGDLPMSVMSKVLG